MGTMRIVFMGNGERGVACLRALIENGESIVGAVVHPGQGAPAQEETVRTLARRHQIPTIDPERINAMESMKGLLAWKPDLMVLAGYNQILQSPVINVAPLGCINLHGGKLPDYRGTAPLNWAIINGETRIGLSIIFVDEGIDTGDIIAEAEFQISIHETIREAVDRTLQIFPEMLLAVVKEIKSGCVMRVRQNPSGGTYYTRRYPRDGIIRWSSMSAFQVHNLVRALTRPYPGAFTFLNGKKVLIWRTSLLEEDIRGVPGRVAFLREEGTVVIAGDKGLMVHEIQVEDNDPVPSNTIFHRMGMDLG
jgi:methionyl-tRNA formyltransferase